MPAKYGQKTLLDAAFAWEFTHFAGEFGQPGTVRANREKGVGLAQHGPTGVEEGSYT